MTTPGITTYENAVRQPALFRQVSRRFRRRKRDVAKFVLEPSLR